MSNTIRYTVEVDKDAYELHAYLEDMTNFNGASVVKKEEVCDNE